MVWFYVYLCAISSDVCCLLRLFCTSTSVQTFNKTLDSFHIACAFSKAVLWCPYLYHAWHSELLKLRETLSCISKFTFAEPRSVSLDVILDNPEDADNDEPVRSIHREEPNCFACENLISPDMLIVWKGDERNLCSPGC